MLIRFIQVLITGLATSLFLFPFNLPISLEVNTKLILAVLGGGFLILDKVKGRNPVVSRYFFILSLICAIISVWGFLVTTINGTSDYSFTKYLLSVWIWLSAAYAVVWLTRMTHGEDLSVDIISNYLIGVCTAQCLLAYAMTIWPSLGTFIDSLMGEGEAFMSATEGRIHGLGAALDPAGLRFSAVLVIISFLLAELDYDRQQWLAVYYLSAFMIITILGNMIARSTTIGSLIAILLFIILRWPRKGTIVIDRSWGIIGGGLILVILVSTWLYRVDPSFRSNLRFGFEGFFSLIEKGRWEVRSNEILKGMIVWPEYLKTWIIGDGYFDSPGTPNRFGQVLDGFYMHTDIGYLRFIFYFGCIGLMGMIAAFGYMTFTCVKAHPEYKWMFVSLLLVNLIGWFKVSSDIIMVFAPFLILAFLKQNDEPCISCTT